MAQIRLTENHWYRFAEQDGSIHIGQYTGRDQGFECCVCGKGCKAYTFNIWHSEDGDYEDLLKELADSILDESWLSTQNKPKEGSIYQCNGKFKFIEYSEDDEED